MLTPHTKERMAGARSAAKLAALAVEMTHWNSPGLGGEMLRDRWPSLSGKRATARALRAILADRGAGVPATEAEMRATFMTPEESAEFAALIATGARLPLYRFSSSWRRTGWYASREDAWAVWTHRHAPTAVETVCPTADDRHVLAVKKVNGRREIVLTRCWAEVVEWFATRKALP